MANPAPLTIQPMSPSKAIYDKSYLDAWISFGSSSSKSRNSKISLCLNNALSSKFNFASKAKTSPSPVVTSGLISTIEQSFSTKTLYKESKNFAALFTDSFGILILNAIRRAWKGDNPITGSIVSLKIFSGVLAATSSISVPPSSEAINVIRSVARSMTKPT